MFRQTHICQKSPKIHAILRISLVLIPTIKGDNGNSQRYLYPRWDCVYKPFELQLYHVISHKKLVNPVLFTNQLQISCKSQLQIASFLREIPHFLWDSSGFPMVFLSEACVATLPSLSSWSSSINCWWGSGVSWMVNSSRGELVWVVYLYIDIQFILVQ